MGGRGVAAFGTYGARNPKRFHDDSGIGMARGGASATSMVVNAFGSESLQETIDYVDDAMRRVTGQDRYVTVDINGDATGERGTYAWMNMMTGTMGLNTDYLKYDTARVEKSYANDVAEGFHPKGTTYKDIMVHEAAHRLDGLLTQKIGSNNMASTHIVRQAIRNLQAAGHKGTSLYLQRQLSGYGAKFFKNHSGDKYVETFAEAIADYSANGSKANPLSIEIVNVMREYL